MRDKKSFRLQDLPQTLEYLINDMSKYDPLKEFSKFLETEVQPCLLKFLGFRMKAFMLAAGLGKRLLPLTQDKPKPLLEVGGIPLIQRNL